MKKTEHEQFVLSQHPYRIWPRKDEKPKDGRYRTYIKCSETSGGRKLIKKAKYDDLIEELYLLYAPEEKRKEELYRGFTLRKLYPEWVKHKRLHTNAETYIMRINSDWKTYYSEDPIIDIPFVELTKVQLDEWAHQLIKAHNMTKTRYYNVTVIMRQGLQYAVELGIIQASPFDSVKIDGGRLFRKVKKKADHTQVFTKEEARQIIQMAWDDFHNHVKVYELAPLAVIFQLQTALRIGEVCAAQFEDVERENYFHVQRMLRRDLKEIVEHTKSDCGDREVFLSSMAKDVIQAALTRQRELGINHRFIFSIRENEPLPERPVADLYKKYCKRIGTVMKSSHKARKTVISAWIDNDININTARTMAGHSSEQTTLRNYVFDRSTEVEKKEQLENAVSF